MHPRILLINPWIHDFAAMNLWARPLGLLRVAEFLSAFKADLGFLDCLDDYAPRADHRGKYPKAPLPTPESVRGIRREYGRYGISPEMFEKKLTAQAPFDAILVTSLMTYWYPGVFEAIRICKNRFPRVPVVLGGIYARLFPRHAKTHSGADAVYTESGLEKLPLWLSALGVDLTPRRGPRQPYYRLDLYPQAKYAPLLTSEGCPFSCPYCASRLLYPQFHRRGQAEILQEVAELANRGVEDFAFYDDALLYQAGEHFHPLLEKIVALRLPVRFHTPNGLHARWLDAQSARLMKAAGFETIRLSLETTDASRQQQLGGKVSNADFLRALAALRQAGFHKRQIGVYLLYGLPDQPWEEVEAGADWLMRQGVRVHLAEFSPLPGTAAWDVWRSRGICSQEMDPLLTNNTVFSHLYSGYSGKKIQTLKRRIAESNRAS